MGSPPRDVRELTRHTLDELVKEGGQLVAQEFLREKGEHTAFDLTGGYQSWYSRALPLVRQLLPDRYAEFRDLYRPEHRDTVDAITYGIGDYLTGVPAAPGNDGRPPFDAKVVFGQKLGSQIAILRSAGERLDAVVADVEALLQANLFDSELAAGEELVERGHPRAAAAVAGVVLREHLTSVAAAHGAGPIDAAAGIGALNEALRAAGVYDVPEWRRLQRLDDLHDHCLSRAERAPTIELLQGVQRAVRTIF